MFLKVTLITLQAVFVLTASTVNNGGSLQSTASSSSSTSSAKASEVHKPIQAANTEESSDTRFFVGCTFADLAVGLRRAVVSIQAPPPLVANTITGTVVFSQNGCGQPVTITGTISGTALTPGLHGWHVHERGDLGNGCANTLAHFNPFTIPHGAPSFPIKFRHVGDLGNIVANAANTATITVTDNIITLFGENSIIGRGLTIHAAPDDFVTQPTGNSGGRIGCGVIGFQA